MLLLCPAGTGQSEAGARDACAHFACRSEGGAYRCVEGSKCGCGSHRVQIGRAGLSAAQERPATTVTPSQESDGLRSAAVNADAEIAAFGTCGALWLAPHSLVQRPSHLPA